MDMLKSPLARDALIVACLVWGALSIHSRLDRMEYQINVSACGCDRSMFGVGNIVNVKNENTAEVGNIYDLAYKLESDRYEHVFGTGGIAGEHQRSTGNEGCVAGCGCACDQRRVAGPQSGTLRPSGRIHGDVQSQHASHDAADDGN